MRVELDFASEFSQQGALIGEPSHLELAIDLVAIQTYLEGPTLRGHQGYHSQSVRVFLQQFFRQTDGSWKITSSSAVSNLYARTHLHPPTHRDVWMPSY